MPRGLQQACIMTAEGKRPAATWWTPDAQAGVIDELSAITARRSAEHDTRSLRWLIWLGAPALLVLGAADLWHYFHVVGIGPTMVGVLLLAALGAFPVLLLRRWPMCGWWATIGVEALFAALLASSRDDTPWPWGFAGMLAFCIALAAVVPTVQQATALAMWCSIQLIGIFLSLSGMGDSTSELFSLVGTALATGVTVVVALAVVGEREAQRRLVVAEHVGEEDRERRALLEERSRIARDLHDVVAHHMSVITVQADSAPYRLMGMDAATRSEFDSIAETSRTALADMRRVLQILRTRSTEAVDLSPNAGLAQLAKLVETVGRVGLTVRLDTPPNLGDLKIRPELDLAAYRIVQEALSNVIRHAPGAEASVCVRLSGGTLRVEVRNGPGRPGQVFGRPESAEHALGLDGMAERVQALGGVLLAEPAADGGFIVVVALPIEPSS
jgi:signal transduction histidine kinase